MAKCIAPTRLVWVAVIAILVPLVPLPLPINPLRLAVRRRRLAVLADLLMTRKGVQRVVRQHRLTLRRPPTPVALRVNSGVGLPILVSPILQLVIIPALAVPRQRPLIARHRILKIVPTLVIILLAPVVALMMAKVVHQVVIHNQHALENTNRRGLPILLVTIINAPLVVIGQMVVQWGAIPVIQDQLEPPARRASIGVVPTILASPMVQRVAVTLLARVVPLVSTGVVQLIVANQTMKLARPTAAVTMIKLLAKLLVANGVCPPMGRIVTLDLIRASVSLMFPAAVTCRP